MLALVWAPVRFAEGWALAVHLFDILVFSLLIAATQAASSPFFSYFLFLLVCGTLRWQVRGTLWTAAAAIAAYAGVSLYVANVLGLPGFERNTFLIRTIYIAVITAMLAALSAHQHRFQTEIGRIAGWPRRISRDPDAVVSEVLYHARAILDAPRTLLAWQESDTEGVMFAWLGQGEVERASGAETEYLPMVSPALESRSFQASDASKGDGLVVVHSARGFRRRDSRPINEALRTRFEMRAVQSWALDGELIRGRLFCLDKVRMGIDDLVVGELVARQITSRLEGTLMLGRLQYAAALEERVRVAGDLHDSLLQAQAGAALQLLAARRLLERRPEAARQGLEEVQLLLEHGELEMRSFIRGLRPSHAPRATAYEELTSRLEALAQRVERQWSIAVRLHLRGPVNRIAEPLADNLYRLTQEAVVNAARHAEASAVDVSLKVAGSTVAIEVVDDGRGFPFQGTYDLARLNELKLGPVALRERVTRLGGALTVTSTNTGTTVHMTLAIAEMVD